MFRHELASALAVLQDVTGAIRPEWKDLIAYLSAAHHGRVRLSIRSMPGEKLPSHASARFARGVWDGDVLPSLDLGGGVIAPEIRLSLQPMEVGLADDGQRSWADRVLRLRNDREIGPFRLAYLEAILRAADRAASEQESKVNA
jgi:CRISPR-associated endonuclease/helicase Cas3